MLIVLFYRLIKDGFGGPQTEAAQAHLDAIKERLAKIEEESATRKNDLDNAGDPSCSSLDPIFWWRYQGFYEILLQYAK